MSEQRQKEIHDKGFDLTGVSQYGKIKLGTKVIEDATVLVDTIYTPSRYARYTKHEVIMALARNDITTLRKMSNYFYQTSGLYRNMCHYYAFMYRYDWYVAAEILDKTVNNDKV